MSRCLSASSGAVAMTCSRSSGSQSSSRDRQHHRDILHDQEAHRDATVQRINFALVGEQLDNDDGAGKGQRDGDVQRRQVRHAEGQRNQIAEYGGENDLSDAGRQRHRPQVLDQVQVELQPHHEQQQRHADLRQQINLVVRRHPAEHGRAGHDPHRDERHDQRLAQPERDGPRQGRNQQERGEFVIDASHFFRIYCCIMLAGIVSQGGI